MSEIKPHPKQVEAQAIAEDRQKERQALKKIVEETTKRGAHFVEIAPWNYNTNKPSKQGRMTIAYCVHHRNVVLMSTAICHPDDKFDKLHGRALAAMNLIEQRAVLVRVPVKEGSSMKNALIQMFTHNTY